MSRKYALVIGNTEYTDTGLAQLTAPGKDAEDFARVLKDKEIGAFDDVSVLLNQPKYVVDEAIDVFFNNKKTDDLLVLYFSGHGVRDEFGTLYLAVKNTARTTLRATGIKSDYIRDVMDQSRSKRQVLILDCCYSGAFPQGTKAEVGGLMGMPQALQGYGRFILTASDAIQMAWEGDKVIGKTDNSLFTHFLVKGLEGEADSDSDGRITVDELYNYTFEQIANITPKQTPTKSASKVEGEIVLRQIMRMEDIKPVALPDELISEIEDIRPLVREGAVQRLSKILSSKNIGLRRSALEALENIAADENTTRRVSQLATQALESYRQVEQKAEESRRAKEEAERLAALKAVEERLGREKAEAERESKGKDEVGLEAIELEALRKAERETPGGLHRKKTLAPQPTPPRQSFLRWGIIGLCVIAAGAWGISSYLSGLGGSPLATEAPVTTEVPPIGSIEVTFWHAYSTGSAEETALATLLEQAAVDMPQYKINVLQVPFNDIFNKYDTDVAAGGGPDMFIAPNDNLGGQVRAGTIADITDLAAGKLGDYSELSQGAMIYDGKLYGIPETLKAVVFWYNTDLLRAPPTTTMGLKDLMEGGTPVALSFGCYHHWGFYGSFGGKIFDANYNFITDETNQAKVSNAINYLDELYQISIANGWPRNDSDGLAPFTEGTVAAITNGNWAMGDYRNALGDKLAVAPIPAGPGGASNPILGVDGWYFNPNSENQEAALEVALYLTNADAQTLMMNEAGHVPANATVEVTDPLIQDLLDAFETSYLRPQVEAMGNYWGNFCGTDQVFDAGTPAADWVKDAFENATK